MLRGSCLCGEVRYEIDGELGPIVCCHCSMCRKAQGTAFGANAPVDAARFRIVAGEDVLREYRSSSTKSRFFCSRCGSPIFSRHDDSPGVARIRIGTLDTPIGARPTAHIHVASQAEWYEILDDLPRHPEVEPERAPAATRPRPAGEVRPTTRSRPGPLSHIRVLDLSRVLAGPWASQVLADLGADVVKVERPGTGDDTRGWGPPFLRDGAGRDTSESAYFVSANRGKRSITVDLARAEGQDVVRRLALKSDVVLENYKVGALARYGLGYEQLAALRPGLVYCSITGFGQTGPYRDRAGYDFLIQALGGLMSITGEPDGAPGGGPMKVGVAITDVMTGMYAVAAVLAALAHRDRTGRGQHVDLALLDVQVASLANQAESHLLTGRPPVRLGNAHPSIVPYQAFATRDGHVVLAVGNDGQFARLCAVVGDPALAQDPRFETNAARVRHRAELIARLGPLLAARPGAEWIASLEQAGVPCGPIHDLAQVFDDPQVRHRGMRVEAEHPLSGTVPMVASPIRLSRTPVRDPVAPPLLGQHTREVLRGLLDMTAEQVEALRERGVV